MEGVCWRRYIDITDGPFTVSHGSPQACTVSTERQTFTDIDLVRFRCKHFDVFHTLNEESRARPTDFGIFGADANNAISTQENSD